MRLKMSEEEKYEDSESKVILDLPDDVIFLILSFCDKQTLGRLACVCQRFKFLSEMDNVWLSKRQNILTVGPARGCRRGYFPVKDQCRISSRWVNGSWDNVTITLHRTRQMPCIQLSDERLWTTYNNTVRCFSTHKHNRRGNTSPYEKCIVNHCDISRLIVADQHTLISDRCGGIQISDTCTHERLACVEKAHSDDVLALSYESNIIVSGSRDATVKVWRLDDLNENIECLHTTGMDDRVCCTAVCCDIGKYVIGTAGVRFLPPVQLWDLNRNVLLSSLGTEEVFRHGAGVLDACFESPVTLITGGYDTITRVWDLRAPLNKCTMKLEDPYDETVYCVRSAGEYTILCGMARHGLVELWDRRATKEPLHLYFTSGRGSTPVYSLALCNTGLYVGLDLSTAMLDFDL